MDHELRAIFIRSEIHAGQATGGRVIYCDDGNYYLCKSPTFCKHPFPFLLANEAISWNLASLLNMPCLPFRIVNLQGKSLFGVKFDYRFRDRKTISLSKCNLMNWQDVPGILIFNLFVCNLDWHIRNHLVLKASKRLAFNLFIIDNSFSLLGPSPWKRARLQANHPLEHYLYDYELNHMLRSRDDLHKSLNLLENLTYDEIYTAVSSIPKEWLPKYDTNLLILVAALLKRQHEVRHLIEKRLNQDRELPPAQRFFANLAN